jgi:hypothetical protein
MQVFEAEAASAQKVVQFTSRSKSSLRRRQPVDAIIPFLSRYL